MTYIIIAFIIAATDLLIKNFIERYYWTYRDKYIFGGFMRITKSHNNGGFLNFLEKTPKMFKLISYIIFIIVTIAFGLVIGKNRSKLVKMGLALIFGGAVSNESDRLIKGSVTDYVSFRLPFIKKIMFNVADFAIFAGAAMVCVGEALKSD